MCVCAGRILLLVCFNYFLCVVCRKWKTAEARLQKEGTPTQPDMELVGGLRIPGSIWHNLYQ